MDPRIRARLERLEALIDAAPSPFAWVELCAALSEWPDRDQLELGIELVRARMHAWPRATRTAPEWWRLAWERCVPEPRLVLAGTLEAPLLPATGGGSFPVQHYIHHHDCIYYVRYRHGYLSVAIDQVGHGRYHCLDRDLIETELRCVEAHASGDGGWWSYEETNAILSLIGQAIRAGDVARLEFPDSVAALQASEHYMLGPYPLLVTSLDGPETPPRERKYSDPFQPSNCRWMDLMRLGEPVPSAVEHHLSQTRPPSLGPAPGPSRRILFRWAPWPNEPPTVAQRCEIRLLRKIPVHAAMVDVCVFVDDDHVASKADDGTLRLSDLRDASCVPVDPGSEPALRLAEVPDPYDETVMLDERRELVADGRELVVRELDSGRMDRRVGPFSDIDMMIVGPNGLVLTTDGHDVRIWDINDDWSVALDGSGWPGELAFLADGRVAWVDGGDQGKGLRIFDSYTGQCLAEYGGIEGCAVATRGAFVVVGDNEGALWLFEVSPPVPVPESANVE